MEPYKKEIEAARAAGDFERERQFILKATSSWGPMVMEMFGSSVNVKGIENLPDSGPVVMVGNHQGYADIFTYFSVFTKFQFSFVAKENLGNLPFYGKWIRRIRSVLIKRNDPRASLKAISEGIEYLKQFHFVDSEHEVNNLLKDGKSVLCEGAQGTMLDIDFGSYPFVTSSNTVCAGACTGLGVAPNRIGEVYGIFKAYCTRVGAGPFPTELFDETGDKMCTLGHEFGSVTGRKRRCGWIDLVALKYSVMINGVTKLIMMKSDVLDTFETIKACVAYKVNDEEIDYFPYDITEGVEPVYAELPGWQTDMTKMQSEDEFPEEFNAYLTFLEEQLGVQIKIVSVGPDRAQTIERYTEE